MATVRAAGESDLGAIVEIYNHYVRETAVTFDIEPFSTLTRRPWFDGFANSGRHRLLVAEEEGLVVGYACSHPFRTKAAYDTSIETTIYLAHDHTGQGLGKQLYAALFRAIEGEDVHRALAGITEGNPGSIALHERFGFRPLGVFSQVGRKFGRYWDVAWLEKAL
jgi:phosphinothricin acetyltransferase